MMLEILLFLRAFLVAFFGLCTLFFLAVGWLALRWIQRDTQGRLFAVWCAFVMLIMAAMMAGFWRMGASY